VRELAVSEQRYRAVLAVIAEGYIFGRRQLIAGALVVEYGFSAFIFAADDPTALQIFGQEIAPGVRDAVQAIRS
jgi:hypothetical protein